MNAVDLSKWLRETAQEFSAVGQPVTAARLRLAAEVCAPPALEMVISGEDTRYEIAIRVRDDERMPMDPRPVWTERDHLPAAELERLLIYLVRLDPTRILAAGRHAESRWAVTKEGERLLEGRRPDFADRGEEPVPAGIDPGFARVRRSGVSPDWHPLVSPWSLTLPRLFADGTVLPLTEMMIRLQVLGVREAEMDGVIEKLKTHPCVTADKALNFRWANPALDPRESGCGCAEAIKEGMALWTREIPAEERCHG